MNKLIRNIFVRNWGLKLFSFLLALVFWFSIIPEEKLSSAISVTVPLETVNLPAGLVIVEKPTPNIDVTIKVPNRLIDVISADTVRARLDMRMARVEQTEFPINRNMISLPQGAEVREISPSHVRMRLERSREIIMEVEPALIGQLPEHLEIVSVEVIPNEVSIIGPESKVKETDKVRTSPIDKSSLTESVEIEVDLILPDPALNMASYETIFTVRIDIKEKDTEEEIPQKKKRKAGY